jgi:hypothetical protein
MTDEPAKRVALKVSVGGKTHDVTFDELTLSNNLGLEALVTLLVEKKIFTPEELHKMMEKIRRDRYRDKPDTPDSPEK